MRVLNETRTAELRLPGGGRAEVTERVRGVDARADGSGFLFATVEPESVTVHRAGEMRHVAFPAAPRPRAAMLALPALYLATRLLLRNRRKR